MSHLMQVSLSEEPTLEMCSELMRSNAEEEKGKDECQRRRQQPALTLFDKLPLVCIKPQK